MHLSRKVLIIFWLGIVIYLLKSQGGYAKKRTVKHDARITNRPDDVPVVKCGGDISLTCVAEGKPTPKIEWWYHNEELDVNGRKAILKQAAREGRIKIKTEEMYLVRSTLIIRDVDESDEGMYQCRASNSPVREDENINIYQHWRIEEVPVNKVICRDTVLTHTEVYPASSYNNSVFTEAAERAATSLGLTSSDLPTTTTKQVETPPKKTSHVTSLATTTTTTTKTHSPRIKTSSTTSVKMIPKKTPKSKDQSINSVHKLKKNFGKKISSNVIEKESNKNVNIIELQHKKNQKNSGRVNGATLEQSGNGGRNSGSGIYRWSWMTGMLLSPVAAFVFLTSCS